MAYGDNGGNSANYEPNSYPTAPKTDSSYSEPPLNLGDVAVDRYDHREGNDDYSQTGDLYRLMSEDAKERLVENIVGSLGEVPEEIQKRQLCQFFRADVDYGRRIAKKLGIEIDSSLMSEEAKTVKA